MHPDCSTCATCGLPGRLVGRGLCATCYGRAWRAGEIPRRTKKIKEPKRKPRVERICQRCGKAFMVPPSQVAKYPFHCSAACKDSGIAEWRDCERCGARFKANRQQVLTGNGRFCSHKCWGLSKRNRIERACLQCGAIFAVVPGQIAKGRGLYCSKTCRSLAGTVERQCRHCGKQFAAKLSNFNAGKAKYCSTECVILGRRAAKPPRFAPPLRVGPPRPCEACGTFTKHNRFCSEQCADIGHKVPKVQSPCETCGGPISHYPRQPRRFCSAACQLASYPPSQQPERKQQAAKNWRRDVLRRDKHTCQYCGTQDGPLNAHHIKPWSSHPELRTVLSNGLTLCERCHLIEHNPHLSEEIA